MMLVMLTENGMSMKRALSGDVVKWPKHAQSIAEPRLRHAAPEKCGA